MNAKALYTLEFDKILEMLAAVCQTEGAAESARHLTPSSDIEKVMKKQRQTTDAKTLIGIKGLPSFGRVKDIRESVERAEKDAVLSLRELLDCAGVLRTARSLLDYVKSDRTPDTSLAEIFDRLTPNRALEEKITRSIVAEDFVADEASPELSDIRRKKRNTDAKIKEILQRYTSGQSKYLQENIVTTRGGRFVVPVKAEYRNEVKGLVHDTSSSGATVFIEPMAVVEANNELRELEAREAREIERILRDLSAGVAVNAQTMNLNYLNITELAFIFACGELSYQMNAAPPKISDKKIIELYRARHPLLDKKTVVPVSVTLGRDYKMVVITGPNTGGKTVTLKTLGLFALMTQAGLHIPADDTSVMGVFDEVFSDIGDEQSIEQSLSTFSSHMKGIVTIMDKMTENSLVLFDELGAGTDPVEGAALAMAILEEARLGGTLCAATTHYAELKAYALETEGVVNASCEFDVETLRPTYRLIIGTPGKSNAFAISEKLGLSPAIVARAERFVDTGSRNFENVIQKLEETRKELEKEKSAEEKSRREFEEYRAKSEAELKSRLAGAEKEADRMRKKAQELLDGARATSEYVIAELEKAKKEKESERFGDAIAEAKKNARARVREYDDRMNPVIGADDDADYVLPRPLKKGDVIRHRNLGTQGVVLEDPDKNGNLSVRMGAVKMRVSEKDLRLVEDAEEAKKAQQKKEARARAQVTKSFKLECDVRGMTGEEAWFVVDQYIDSAIVAGVHQATVIHGKGTGALRNALQNQFKHDKRVKSFRAGAYGEGDYGVTVLEL
ncbi:MAG: endonuclease MutS2 [Ruminococcaceae bacterium]|jgi:DNA mismatch repair protein MutS2|nr:endonuclease MutS2 [Oscillospiraceae bacterium]